MVRRISFTGASLTIVLLSIQMLNLNNDLTSIVTIQRRSLIFTTTTSRHQRLYQNSDKNIPAPTYNNESIEHHNAFISSIGSSDAAVAATTVDQLYRQYLLQLSTSSSYVPNGHSTIFVPKYQNFSYYYSSLEEMKLRHDRFPSTQERVQLYMSTWYVPPCSDNIDGHILYTYAKNNETPSTFNQTTATGTVIVQPISIRAPKTGKNTTLTTATIPPLLLSIDSTYSRNPYFFLYDRNIIVNECADNLCHDAHQYFIPYVDQYYNITTDDIDIDNNNNNIPLLLQHGDANFYRAKVVHRIDALPHVHHVSHMGNPNIPMFKKFRRAMTQIEIASIVATAGSKNVNRQCYKMGQHRISTETMTVVAVAAGKKAPIQYDAFQPIISIVSNFGRHFYSLMHVIENDKLTWNQKASKAIYRGLCTGRSKSKYRGKTLEDVSDYELCQQVPRCRLVYGYNNSSLVDAKLTTSKQNDIAYTIHGVPMIGRTLSMEEILRFKGVIMIEGNDVSSGLKWALFSKSVVFTQKPTYTSWAMEELLVPWVHYIPIADDLSDVHEKVQWMIDHDDEAREIANNGHLWITDMIFHPHSIHDHEAIIKETFRRYRAHFRYCPTLL